MFLSNNIGGKGVYEQNYLGILNIIHVNGTKILIFLRNSKYCRNDLSCCYEQLYHSTVRVYKDVLIGHLMYILKNLKKKKKTCNVTQSSTSAQVFFTFFKLNKWHQIEESITYPFRVLRKLKVAFYFFIGCRVQNLKS